MKHIKKIGAIASVFAIVIALSAFNFQQEKPQEEPKPTNLKVLPKNISHDELISTMKEFNVALGVKCGFCHAPSKEDPKKLDFASDENHKKEIGRAMIKMTQKINKNILIVAGIAHRPKQFLVKLVMAAKKNQKWS
ncbi:c-type cytochrome [Sphingobacterium sp. E70]|uniref:c-type cytochrome n=1 Tax=Sphingobacterium sp. E70 TaxID=2853439 RepID=UPI00211B8DAB|nr:c-type cytochrome [Sphingobacterium sp. E70]ULT25316.1 c-type cytochrome [Sphingobacterium sp. E70]